MRRAALVMAKAPMAGQSKTRLSPRLTLDVAAQLSAAFIRDAVELAQSVRPATPPSVVNEIVAVSPPDASEAFAELLPGVDQIAQIGSDLGHRLAHVLSEAIEQGYEQVVAINADGPTLPSRLVADAFDQLANSEVDVVLGPTEDGGYYLIGWKRPHPEIVVEVEMSTASVLADTLVVAERLNLSVKLLDPWYDVDEPSDLDRLLSDINNGVPCGRHTVDTLRQSGLL